MSSSDNGLAIKAIHVLTTGMGYQHKEHRYASWKPKLLWALTSRSWIRIPINAYLIEHRDGLVLFDTGLDPKIESDPNYVSSQIVRFFLRRLFRLQINAQDSLTSNLRRLGYAADDISKAIISHLHFDHVGGIAEISQADLLVSSEAWRQLSSSHPEREYIFREHIELPNAKWKQIDFAPLDDSTLAPFGGCYDVMGDGTMMLLPTPGHTPGCMSLLVRATGLQPMLFVGDLTYDADRLLNDQLPGIGDKVRLKSSYAKVRTLKNQMPDLLILPTHDPVASEALAISSARDSRRQV